MAMSIAIDSAVAGRHLLPRRPGRASACRSMTALYTCRCRIAMRFLWLFSAAFCVSI